MKKDQGYVCDFCGKNIKQPVEDTVCIHTKGIFSEKGFALQFIEAVPGIKDHKDFCAECRACTFLTAAETFVKHFTTEIREREWDLLDKIRDKE